MRSDGQRWDERYRAVDSVEPRRPEAIERWPEGDLLLPTAGRCVDIASGPGPVSLWAAARGLDVVALDASRVAIEQLRAAARSLGCTDHVDARVIDLDDGLPADVDDVDMIVCQRFRDPALNSVMLDRLRIGGCAVVTVLSMVGAPTPGEFHARPRALWNEFSADARCEILHHHEGDGIADIVVRRC